MRSNDLDQKKAASNQLDIEFQGVLAHAGISGRGACLRGLRHSFGVGTLQAGVPITLLQRWLRHARLSTTEIYTKVIGPEEIAFARLF
ncbi:MAG: tyrosine-type recombinase/integrase [Hyphomicrobium sp.]|nr:tyrosine-type recombinase/integrase [Hyphomicrobium sp.]